MNPHGSPAGPLPDAAVPSVNALLTAEDLAVRWQVPVAQVYRLARDGRVPAVRLGRYYRFRLEAVQTFEESGGTGA